MTKVRLDKLLVDRALAASRERAQALVLAGRVLVNEQRVDKPGTSIAADATLRLTGEDLRYVSRGGLKLEGALATWKIDVQGLPCADIGTSTGGFTDCLLQHGAASVLGVDTGYGQIAHKLRVDSRVKLLERTNARTLAPGALGSLSAQPIAFFAMDVSFISATLVLPAVLRALARPPQNTVPAPAGVTGATGVTGVTGAGWAGEAVILVKPQFEAGREHVGKGGIVRDPEAQALAVARVTAAVGELGGARLGLMESPILGMEGNREFLLHARWDARV